MLKTHWEQQKIHIFLNLRRPSFWKLEDASMGHLQKPLILETLNIAAWKNVINSTIEWNF
jgi:hypothetical protein